VERCASAQAVISHTDDLRPLSVLLSACDSECVSVFLSVSVSFLVFLWAVLS